MPITTRRAVWLSIAWLGLGLASGLPLLGSDRALNYWSVYALERSLSLDNVFVFLLVLDYFLIPREHRLRVVRWGIAFALALRAATIAAGAALIESFSVITYGLGAILLVLAARMLRSREEPLDPSRSMAFRAVSRVVRLTDDRSTGGFVARTARGWAVTPLGLALVAFAAADLTFAVDAISGAFGITTDFLAIWLANALALFGLVPLLVLVRALVQRLRYLNQTFAAVLLFIGARLLTDDVVTLGPVASLVAIAVILATGVAASLVADRMAPPPAPEREERRPPRCPTRHADPREEHRASAL